MKRFILRLLLIIIVGLFLMLTSKNNYLIALVSQENISERRAIFISYLEYLEYFMGKDNKTQKVIIEKMLDNIERSGFNMIILHVRPFSDAIYKSSIYPWSYTLTGIEDKNPGFDFLEYFIKESHQRNIELHAWINPYRIRNSSLDIALSAKNPAKINNDLVMSNETGMFYNPAKEEVTSLIIAGILEIIDNYNIDGIHFDDYFYPNDEIAENEYNIYIANGGSLSKSDYYLMTINKMIERVYQAIKKKDNNIIFGISPEGNINNNYQNNYSDVKLWGASDKYVDYLMPQIYFGFKHDLKPFINTAKEWENIVTSDSVDLLIALAGYKVNTIDNLAGSGKDEWLVNSDILMKQVIYSRSLKHYQGIAVFRYANLFREDNHLETNNLKMLFTN